jgi:hypothetical protein
MAAYRLLQDGEWHPYEVIRQRVARVVEPGEAYRDAENERKRMAGNRRGQKSKVEVPRRTPKSESEVIWIGQKAKARDYLANRSTLEHDRRPDGRFIRVQPKHLARVRELLAAEGMLVETPPRKKRRKKAEADRQVSTRASAPEADWARS